MDFLHRNDWYENGDIIVLHCDTQCSFMIMDDTNFSAYQRGKRYQRYGGYFKYSPANVIVPADGHWNVVIDLAGSKPTRHPHLCVIKRNDCVIQTV